VDIYPVQEKDQRARVHSDGWKWNKQKSGCKKRSRDPVDLGALRTCVAEQDTQCRINRTVDRDRPQSLRHQIRSRSLWKNKSQVDTSNGSQSPFVELALSLKEKSEMEICGREGAYLTMYSLVFIKKNIV
jgi:hypothetical protein